jgi:uncharacterized protein with HEPN domain
LIEEFTLGIEEYEAYHSDQKKKSAVERQLGIIGEAGNQYRKLAEEWELSSTRQIVQFRNRIIHAYDAFDDSIV